MTRFPCPFLRPLSAANHDRRTPSGWFTGCLSVVLVAGAVSSVSAEQWTAVSGKKTIEAKFVGVMGERAILELPNGKRSAVALRDLQYESRQQALDMEKARQEHMATLSSELARAVEKELEVGPKRVPPPESAPPEYEPLPENASLEQTAQHIAEQLEGAHLRVFWDALPASYQTDVEEIVVQFATEMDPVVWQDMLGAVNRVTELLASRERWVFSYPALEDAGADETVRDGYRAVLGAIQTVFDPEVLTLERLKQGNLGELIAERDSLLAAHLYSLIGLAEGSFDIASSQIEVEMIDDKRGTVTFKPPAVIDSPETQGSSPQGSPPQSYPSPGSPSQGAGKPQTFVLVEDRWVPEEVAKDWEQQIAALKEQIKNELPSQLAKMRSDLEAMKQAVDQTVGPLEEASSEVEFHAGIDRLASQAAGFAMQAFGGMSRGNRPGGNSYGSGMGMENYGQEMEMEGYGQEIESYGEESDGGPRQSGIELPR